MRWQRITTKDLHGQPLLFPESTSRSRFVVDVSSSEHDIVIVVSKSESAASTTVTFLKPFAVSSARIRSTQFLFGSTAMTVPVGPTNSASCSV